MALQYYRDLLQMAVCEMAKCSGKFNDRLLVAWSGYIYKFRWDEFEGMLMPEDLPVFHNLKRRLVDDLHADIESMRSRIAEQTKVALNPITGDQIPIHAHAENVIRAMRGRRAKDSVVAIVEMYKAVVSTGEYRASFQSNNGLLDKNTS
jgi:hypothetical protein